MKPLQTYGPSQNTFRVIYKIEESRAFIESLLADFVHFSSAMTKSLFLEGRLAAKLYLHSNLRFSYNFLISQDLKFFDNPWGNLYIQFLVIMS